MAIGTKQEFIAFAFRKLGAPVIQVNIDPQQAEDALATSLKYMWERHYDFNIRAQFVVPITQTAINQKYFDTSTFGYAVGAQLVTSAETGVTSYWPAAADIRTIDQVFAPTSQVGDYMFDLRYQLTLFDFFGLYFNQGASANPMAAYMEGMSYLQLVNDVFNYPAPFTYTHTTDRLQIETDYSKMANVGYMMVEAYVKIDPDYYPKCWDDRIFQRHYAAELKKQWAQNLIKYSNMPLPGGAILNAPAILQEANRELEAIEAMLLKTQELPIDMMMG